MAVTGAFLWGSLHAGPSTTYTSVDHFRVLDTNDLHDNDLNAYQVLRRVRDVIETGSHDILISVLVRTCQWMMMKFILGPVRLTIWRPMDQDLSLRRQGTTVQCPIRFVAFKSRAMA
jgi:hypothetical protein